MFINPCEGLLQINHMDDPQLAREWDRSKVSDWKASHSSLGNIFGRNAEKLQRKICKYLSYDLDSTVISSFNGSSGEERMKSGCKNRMLKRGLGYPRHIFVEGPKPGIHNYIPFCFHYSSPEQANYLLAKDHQKSSVLKENHIPSDKK